MKKLIKILVLVALVFLFWSLIEARVVQVKQYKIANHELKGLKVILLSDLHLSEITSERKVKQVVDKTNALEPDLIILGGDYTNDNLDFVEPLFKILGGLEAKLGIYWVSGNHDYEVGIQAELKKWTQFYNFQPLDNHRYGLNYQGVKFILAGVADLTKDFTKTEKVLKDTKVDDYVLLISHQPDYIMTLNDSEKQKIDLILSGHTHGGQITFFGYAPYLPSKYGQTFKSGYKEIDGTEIIISNGIGEHLLPMRFFSPPQIVVIEYN